MRTSLLGCLSFCLLAAACGDSPAAPPKLPERPAPTTVPTAPPPTTTSTAKVDAPPTPPPAASDEPSIPTTPPDHADWDRATKTTGVPAAPAACAAYTARGAPKTCVDIPSARGSLETALREKDQNKRDAALASLEGCFAFSPGFVRALRADLAPLECADALTDPLVRKADPAVSPVLAHALAGLSLASRISRTPKPMPKLTPPFTKERVVAHVQALVKEWYVENARVVEEISRAAVKLGFYGRAVVAVEAGLAEMRFIDGTRQIPIPEEWKKDTELKGAYFDTLEEALEPRKARARDAVLVGLKELASVGTVHDARVDRARTILGQMYAGRRIDALDDLVIPALPAKPGLFTALPTFYAGLLLQQEELLDPEALAQVFQRGVPWRVRAALAKQGAKNLDPVLRRGYAWARFDLGRTYWRAADFNAALELVGAEESPAAPERLLGALALALKTGPADAVQMMHAKSPGDLAIRDTKALDALAKEPTVGPMAAYNAAVLLSTAPPDGAKADYFNDVATRFEGAGAALADPALKRRSEARRKTAKLTADAAK